MKTLTHAYILIAGLVILFGACNSLPDKKEQTTESVNVRICTPVLKKINPLIHSSGILSSQSEMKLSFKTGGIIDEIFVNEGQEVKKGQILARLNLSEIQAYANQSQLAFEKAQRDYMRAENLYKDSVATLEQFQNAKTQLEIAQNNVEISMFNLRYSTITAPANGKVLTCMAQENEVIGAGFPVFLFGTNTNTWVVKTNVTDKDIVRLNIGDSAFVYFDAYPSVAFKAQISEISGTADPYTGTYGLELQLQTVDYRLSSGFIAKINIFSSQTKEVLSVPYRSITDADGLNANIFLVQNGKPVKKKVKIYSIDDNEVFIERGIDTTVSIITDGVSYLKKNSIINIVD